MDLNNFIGFDWDEGNFTKSQIKHSISTFETEEVFFNKPLIINFDEKHSINEVRYYCLGKTNNNKLLFTVFTFRKNKIRVISSRPMNKKEKNIYENHTNI